MINRIKDLYEIQKNAFEQLNDYKQEQQIYGQDPAYAGIALKINDQQKTIDGINATLQDAKQQFAKLEYSVKDLLIELREFPNQESAAALNEKLFDQKVKDFTIEFNSDKNEYKLNLEFEDSNTYELTIDQEKVIPRSVKEKLLNSHDKEDNQHMHAQEHSR